MTGQEGERPMRIADRLKLRFHRGDPFADLDGGELAADLQGWDASPEVAEVMIDTLKPDLIIEIGTWKGASAAAMAKVMRKHRDDCAMLCIDTWLGSAEHWINPEWFAMMRCRAGHPDLYRQFMVNMVHEGLQDMVVPLPLPSQQAAIVLTLIGLRAPMIYVDAGHDYVSVASDLQCFWPCLIPGGVLFGDDYADAWPGLKKAVQDFVERRQDEVADFKVIGDKFVLHKHRE